MSLKEAQLTDIKKINLFLTPKHCFEDEFFNGDDGTLMKKDYEEGTDSKEIMDLVF